MTTPQKVANIKDFKESKLLRVDVEGKPIVLVMVQDKVYAMDAVCSHEGGPLEDGTLEGYELKCPWHYAIFDVRNAKVSEQTVWATDLQPYAVKVEERTGDIIVSLQTSKKPAVNEAMVHLESSQEPDSSQKKYYEEEERRAYNKLSLELLSKEPMPGTDIVTFKLSRGNIQHTAGQYAFFKLDGVFADIKGPIRHFSIASSPTEQGYILISTRIRDTPYKQKLAKLEKGKNILAWGAQGEFILHEDHSKPAVFLSGGIGVTPFRSMIKFATDRQLPIKIIMFDSNRNEQNILYKHEFDSWTTQNKNFKVIYTVTDEEETVNINWSGEHGRIDKSMLERHLTKDDIDNGIFYICGPPGMLKAMQELLERDLQIPKGRLKVEAFTGY
ncbi:MAG TPA: Rieske 2Fe-2S domain-containing protein [Nitrososphaera sp.]|nr:Rieske 2Fe-2S domain-containing protein [Nitrososphaera sp.]